jgi:hypothetical protein
MFASRTVSHRLESTVFVDRGRPMAKLKALKAGTVHVEELMAPTGGGLR